MVGLSELVKTRWELAMRSIACSVAALILALAASYPLQAQYRPAYPPGGYSPYGGGRPTFSPYMNIIGRGNPAINYYGITRPQQDLRNALYGAGGGVGAGFPGEDLTDPELRRGTGFVATFNNLTHFYNSNPAMGATGGSGGAAGFGRLGGGVGGISGAGFGSGSAGLNSGSSGAGGAGRGRVSGGFGAPRR